MRQTLNLDGKRFGKLVVLDLAKDHYTSPKGKRHYKWLCECDCGNTCNVVGMFLVNGDTRSCGCLKGKRNVQPPKAPTGQKAFKAFWAWKNMRMRCRRKKAYADVKICDAWQKFDQFIADMGECPPGYSLDRIDPFGNYEPANCRWIPVGEQGRNRRRHVWVARDGVVRLASDWADELGVTGTTVKDWATAGLLGFSHAQRPLHPA